MAPGLAAGSGRRMQKSLRVSPDVRFGHGVGSRGCSKGQTRHWCRYRRSGGISFQGCTTPVDTGTLRTQAADVLGRSRGLFASLRRDAYPTNSDAETRRFVRYWFDDYARRQLASLAISIRGVDDDTIRSALWCASPAFRNNPGRRWPWICRTTEPSRPSKPFRKFLYAVERVARNCIDSGDRFPGQRRVYTRAMPVVSPWMTVPSNVSSVSERDRLPAMHFRWSGWVTLSESSDVRSVRRRHGGREECRRPAFDAGHSLQAESATEAASGSGTGAVHRPPRVGETTRVLADHGR